ncbi:MAG: hypothetical protein NT019_03425 [Candidatus Adlerbacteria bacterium]|nr:hypothetical protein [Candidatus Adlerbacteria bacterium]
MTDAVSFVTGLVADISRKGGIGDFEGVEKDLNVLADTIVVQAIDRDEGTADAIFHAVETAWSVLATKNGPDKGIQSLEHVEAELRALTRVLGALLQHPNDSIEPEVALATKENRDLLSLVSDSRDGLSSYELKQKMLELGHMAYMDLSHLHEKVGELEKAKLVDRYRVGKLTIIHATEKAEKYKLTD